MFENVLIALRDHGNPRRNGLIFVMLLTFAPLTIMLLVLIARSVAEGQWILLGVAVAIVVFGFGFFGRKFFRRTTRFPVERWILKKDK